MFFLQIRLLGQFQASLDGKVASTFVSDKARALLAYLAVEGHYPHRRETLAHLLWPDKPNTRARANLRSALANLRQIIGDTNADLPHLLVKYHDIKFNPSSRVSVDVEHLTNIYDLKQANTGNITHHTEALEIYQGEFMSGFNLPDSRPFEEWALMKREHFSRMMVAILQRASNYYEMRADFESALPFAWRQVELTPWQESARHQLMRILYHMDRRDEALQQYLNLKDILLEDLNIEPGLKISQFYKSILHGKEEIPLVTSKDKGNDRASLPEFLRGEDTQTLASETFVARQQELDRLHTQLDAMMNGKGHILLVTGETGSGKTMLIREFVRQAQSRYPDLVSAAGYCNAYTGTGDPYLPFREILCQLSGDIRVDWSAGSFSRRYAKNLWNMIPITCQSLLTYGPDLIDTIIPGKILLEAAASYSTDSQALYAELKEHLHYKKQLHSNVIQQAILFSQITLVLHKIANQAPLLLFLDDLQWADNGTISVLSNLLNQLQSSRILLVGAYRSDEVDFVREDIRHPLSPFLYEIQRCFGDVLINLDASSGKDFIEKLFASESISMDDDFHEQLFNVTGGHALFTVELLRSMQESGLMVKDKIGLWELHSDIRLETLPPKIEGIIAQRINRLPSDLQHILTIASIEGEIFTAEIIAAVTKLPVHQIITMLSDRLDKQHRLVRPQQISWQGDQSVSTYQFRHFLFQNYIYLSQDKIQRSRLHDQVGSEMEKINGEIKNHYAVHLARHFHKANRIGKALTYYTLAGERAVHISAFPEAIKQFEAAISLLSTLPQNPARNKQELNLQIQLGTAYQATMGFGNEKVGTAYKRAWELSKNVDDPIQAVTTLHLLLSYYSNMAEFDTGKEILTMLEKRYKELGEEYDDDARLVDWGSGYLDFLLGRIGSAYEKFLHVLSNYNPQKYYSISKRLGMDAGIYCHNWAGLHAVWMGSLDQAKFHLISAMKIAKHHQSNLFLNDALCFGTWISLEMEDYTAAKEYSEASLELTAKEHYFFYEAIALTLKGRLLSREGQHLNAIASIQKGLDMFKQTDMVTFQPFFLHALAEAYFKAKQVDDSLEVILKTELIQNKTGESWNKSLIQKIKGDIQQIRGNEIAAEKSYLASIATAQEQSTKLLELEAVKQLARLWQRQGKTQQAQEKLGSLYTSFTEGLDTPMLIEAKKLLEEWVK